MKKVLSALSLIILCYNSSASNELGSEITYKHLGGSYYRITLKIYRSCTQTSLDSVKQLVIYSDDTSSSDTLSLSRAFITRHTMKNDGSSYCDPINSASSNGGYSWEVHSYMTDVDLDASPFSSAICKFYIGYQTSAKQSYSAIGTDSSYNFAFINRCYGNNNSPSFLFTPRIHIGQNQPMFMNFAGIDTLDIYDSLVYQMAPYFRTRSDSGDYPTGTKYARPLSIYAPGNPDQVVITANPPIGFYCDRITGDMICTPTANETSVLVQEIQEFRRIEGGLVLIGIVRRDISLNISAVPGNNPPQIPGPYLFNNCAEDTLKYSYPIRDLNFVPPPPAVGIVDTSEVEVSNRPKGLSYRIDSAFRERSLNITYVRDTAGLRRPVTFFFCLRAYDDHSPYFSSAERMIRVIVTPRPHIDSIRILNRGCKQRQFICHIDSSRYSRIYYNWHLIRLGPVPKSFLYTSSSPLHRFTDTGTYRISCLVSLHPNMSCPTIVYDTITIDTAGLSLEVFPRDTTTCFPIDSTLSVKAHIGNQRGSIQHLWSGGDTSISTKYKLAWTDTTQSYKYNYVLKDEDGCELMDSAMFRILYTPKLNFQLSPDTPDCYKKVIARNRITYKYPVSINWSHNSQGFDYDSVMFPADSGIYTLTAFSQGCMTTMDTFIRVKPSPFTKILFNPWDSVMCQGRKILMSDDSKKGSNYKFAWYYDGILQSVQSSAVEPMFQTTGDHEVVLISSLGACADTARFKGKVYQTPQLVSRWVNDSQQCFEGALFKLHATSVADGDWLSNRWNYSTYSDSLKVSYGTSGVFTVNYTPVSAKGCELVHPFKLEVLPKPFKPVILHYGTMLVAYPPNELGYKHQWFLNGNPLTNTLGMDTVWADWPGDYTLVSGLSGECTDTSDAIHFYGQGLNTSKQSGYEIQPNPNNGTFRLVFADAGINEIRIINLTGQEILSQSLNAKETSITEKLAPGIYFIHVKTGDTHFKVKKLIIE